MIELKQVSAGYGGSAVLQDVSLTLEAGALTSIVGSNGCGKTTLLKVMLGMVRRSSGDITIDARPLDGLTRNEAARRVAYLAQGKNTPDMTVEQLVLHGRFPHLSYPRRYTLQDRQIARAAMEQLGLAPLAHRPLHTLSGGMRQTAYIAMALAQGTDHILLDEPTTYLDITHQLDLMKTLRSLADSGKGIAAVMHDLPMALTFSDQIVVLQGGRVLDQGRPEQVFERNTVQQALGVRLERSANGRSYHYAYPL